MTKRKPDPGIPSQRTLRHRVEALERIRDIQAQANGGIFRAVDALFEAVEEMRRELEKRDAVDREAMERRAEQLRALKLRIAALRAGKPLRRPGDR